jgi:hypothetical protein
MAITEYTRNADRAILNTVFENTVRRVNKCLETGGETSNITCNVLNCNHQAHRYFWTSCIYTLSKISYLIIYSFFSIASAVHFSDPVPSRHSLATVTLRPQSAFHTVALRTHKAHSVLTPNTFYDVRLNFFYSNKRLLLPACCSNTWKCAQISKKTQHYCFSVLVVLQDHSTCFGHFPHPSSGVQLLQLTVTGITYCNILV